MDHEAKAMLWLEECPEAYEMFDKFAKELVYAGVRKAGSKAIAERCRWQSMISRKGKFKWNNNYTRFVAKLWCERNPRYASLFSFRSSNK